jgi:hypothetical protein
VKQQESTTVTGERVRLRAQRDNELVTATVRENLWAGAGAGVIVLCGSGAWVAMTAATFTEYHLLASAIAAGVTFGGLSVARFSLDEWRDLRDKLRMENMLVDLTMERDNLREKLMRAHATIKELRQQIAVLSTSGTSVKAVATPDELTIAHDTCRMIVERWAANLPYSRDELRNSMTDGEWGSAMALMERAGVIGRGGVSGKKKMIVGNDYDSVMRRVELRIKQEREDVQNKYVRA